MSRLRGFVPALVVTALALLATVIASIAVHREVTVLEKRQFEMDAEGVSSAIARSMRSYELALSASAALFQTVGDVSDIQWQEFVSGLRLAEFYPGFQGVGYAQVTRSAEVAALEQRRRNAGDDGFTVSPKDEREIYVPIVLLEPRDWRNQRALGFDMFSEPIRRAAMERARDTGIASITAKVVLVQEAGADVQPGTLMYIPVYSGGAPLRSVEDRRQRLLGYAYMAMRMDDLIRAVLQRHMPAALDLFDITLHDGKALDDAAQLFHNHPAHHADAPGDLRFKSELDVAGRTWTVSVQAVQGLIDTTDNARPWIVLGAGFIISGLIGAIAAFQSVARSHLSSSRQALAEEVVERKKAQEAAEMANSELIHRVKNTLAVVSAIASQTSRYSTSLPEFNVAFRERLAALGRVQDLLRPGLNAEPPLAQLIEQLLAPYVENGKSRLRVDGPVVTVAKHDVVLFSLAFNELATNAIKYGAWSGTQGLVDVSWSLQETDSGSALNLTWREHGAQASDPGTAGGFGTAVLKFAIERAMGGNIQSAYHDDGICYSIVIPRRSAPQPVS